MPTKTKTVTRKKKTSFKKKSFAGKLLSLKPQQQKAILAVVVILGVSMVGYFGFVRSSASTTNYAVSVGTKTGCYLAGRDYNDNNGNCKQKCRHATAALKNTASQPVRAYCEGYINLNMSESVCVNTHHRWFVKDIGCARRANQEPTNSAPQCIPGYPNYQADAQVDKCIATIIPDAGTGMGQVVVPPVVNGGGQGSGHQQSQGGGGGNNSGGGQQQGSNGGSSSGSSAATTVAPPATDTADKCRLLGRKWDNKAKKCTNSCQADAGALKTGTKSGVKYCGKAVSDNVRMTEDLCVNIRHRVWLVEGCARRADQVDTKNAIQCQPGFAYYNADFKVRSDSALDQETTIDFCELSELVAVANELAGTPGDTDTPPATPVLNDDSSPNNNADQWITTTIAQSLDISMSKVNCYLYGRTWVPAGKDINGKKFKAGCSREECANPALQVRQNNGAQFCEGYVNRNMNQQKCSSLNRKWLEDVQGCAKLPNQQSTKPVLDAIQCKKSHPVYIYHTTDQGADECISKSNLQRLETIANNTGKSVAKLASLPRDRLCQLKGKVWRDGQCKDKVIVTSATSDGTSKKLHMVSVGDSFTADPYLETIIDPACQRSNNNYPHLIAKKLGNVKLDDMSCGCAMTLNFTVGQTHCGVNKPPQFSALSKETDLVTIRTGYNDGPLGVINCHTYYDANPTGSECSDKWKAEGFIINGKSYTQKEVITKVKRELEGALKEIKKRSPNAKIIFVGYSRLYPETGTCAELHIPSGDVAYGKKMMDDLNAMHMQVTKKFGVTFVDMYSLSKGNDICSRAPWVAGITSTPGVAAAYHPYPVEMKAAAAAVVHLLRK